MVRTVALVAYCPCLRLLSGGRTIALARAYCPVVALQSSFRTVNEDGCFSSW